MYQANPVVTSRYNTQEVSRKEDEECGKKVGQIQSQKESVVSLTTLPPPLRDTTTEKKNTQEILKRHGPAAC